MDTSRRHASARACRAFPQTVATNNVSDSAIRLFAKRTISTILLRDLLHGLHAALPQSPNEIKRPTRNSSAEFIVTKVTKRGHKRTHKHIVDLSVILQKNYIAHDHNSTHSHSTRRRQHRAAYCMPAAGAPASCIAAISEYLRHTRLRPRRLFAPAPISRPAAEPALRRASALLWLRAEAVGSGGGRSAKAVSARRDPPQSCARPT